MILIPQALAVHLTKQQQRLLQQVAQSRTQPYHLVQRAQLLLLAYEGFNNTEISQQVRHWRQCWQRRSERRHNLEQAGISDTAMTQQLIEVLSKEQRSGTPAKFLQPNY